MLPSIPSTPFNGDITPPRIMNRSPEALQSEVKMALENAHPGIDAKALIHSLDVLLRGRGNYTIVGSTSMHLQAINNPNPTLTLPIPNDIDVVASDVSVLCMQDFTKIELAKVGLRQPDTRGHVFYMARKGQADLKIDIVSDDKREFRKYALNPVQIHGLRVARIHDTLDDYMFRATDRDFIKQCGGAAQAKEKVSLYMNYFEEQAGTKRTVASGSPENRSGLQPGQRMRSFNLDTPEGRKIRRKLNFG